MAAYLEVARESNRGEQLRFFPTRDEAIAWLEARADAHP